jgi:hypothetical protein
MERGLPGTHNMPTSNYLFEAFFAASLAEAAHPFRGGHRVVPRLGIPTSIESLTYADLASRLGTSRDVARSLVRRLRLPRQTANDGRYGSTSI